MSAVASTASRRRSRAQPSRGERTRPKRLSSAAWNTLQHLSAALIREGQWADAAETAQLLADLGPSEVDAWIRLGGCRLRQGQAPAAREAYERALRLRPGEPRAALGRAEALIQEQRPKAAERALQAVIPSGPSPFAAKAAALLTQLQNRRGEARR